MGSATTQAIAAGRAALAEAKGDTLDLGRELFAARDVIAETATLKGALADAAASAEAKQALVDRVFRASTADTRAVLRASAGARWSSADDLLTGLEELGIRAVAASVGDGQTVIEELAAFQKAVSADPDLEYAVGSALVPGGQKAQVVEKLLGGKASAATTTILAALVRRAAGRRIGDLIKRASTLVAAQADRAVATVQTAAPLTAEQSARIRAALSKAEGREVVLTELVDPSVIGGVRVVIGDRVIDGSVATRLNDLRLALAG